MYSYIKGIVEEIESDFVVIENNDIGYKINVSSNTIKNLNKAQKTKIYTKLIVKEDDMYLCGFYDKEELYMFELLISVSKIGTKIAMGILSNSNPKELSNFILNADVNKISKFPGIGKKTAERMILELKDKVQKNFDEENLLTKNEKVLTIDENNDALEALMSLGYSKQESTFALGNVDKSFSTEEKIKKALSYIMKNKFR